MLPNSASGNGITNQGVTEVQSPGAGFAVVAAWDLGCQGSCYDNKSSQLCKCGFSAPNMIICATEVCHNKR